MSLAQWLRSLVHEDTIQAQIIMCTESMHVFMYVHVLHWGLFLPKQPTTKVRWLTSQLSSHKIVAGIRAVASPIQRGLSLDEHSSNYPAILEQLWCPIYLANHWSLELPCRALVCSDCTIQWFMAYVKLRLLSSRWKT